MYVVFISCGAMSFIFFLSDINAYFMKKSNLKPSCPQYNFPFSIPKYLESCIKFVPCMVHKHQNRAY